MFNIGPAEQFFYHYKMNIYPANTNDIEGFIESGDFSNLNNALYNAAQGFPAMDYMLFGIAQNDSSIINLYDDLDLNYNPYLLDITDRMVSNTDNVLTEWDSYRDSFLASTENNATSSINKMTNDFIYYYEKGFRANKIGIPIGVFSNGSNFPSKFEAYHKQDVSGILGLEAFDAIKAFFNGNDNPSLKHLIDAAAIGDLTNLSSEINEQFDDAYTEFQELNVNFVEQLQIGPGQLNSIYDEIQAGTVLLKTEMLSVLQIATDYVDADGD
jgi:predicted lipoprotein